VQKVLFTHSSNALQTYGQTDRRKSYVNSKAFVT